MKPLGAGQCHRQSVAALSQREQLVVEAQGSSYQDEVVCYSPCDALSLIRRCGPRITMVLFGDVWRADGHTSLDTNATPEARQSHPIAKGVGQYARVNIAGAHKDKGGEKAEERGVGELEQGAGDCQGEWDVGVGDAELVQVVDVGDAKVEWGQEDHLLAGEAG